MISDQVREIPVVSALLDRFPQAVTAGVLRLNELALEVDAGQILEVCCFLKTEGGFRRLSAVTAVDWHPMEPRFEVVYLLHSLENRGDRLRLRCRISGDHPELESITPVWAGANWYEREVFDLFGIQFRNHPNLTRIMMPDEWQGHPLRKDSPVHGHRYSYQDE